MVRKSFANRILPLALLCLTALCCRAQQPFLAGNLKSADLLFHVSPTNNPITEVTPGNIDHVAIYLGGDSIIEAIGRGVVISRLDSLYGREGHWLVGRVKKVDSSRSIAHALHYLGRAYDPLYLADNDDIYCSELVQFSFVDSHDQRLFAPVPMSFHDAEGRITPYWQKFYASRNLPVPEGQPGTNPSELSQRPNVEILGCLQL